MSLEILILKKSTFPRRRFPLLPWHISRHRQMLALEQIEIYHWLLCLKLKF